MSAIATEGRIAERDHERPRHATRRLAPIRSIYPFEPRFFEHGPLAQHFVDEGPADGGRGTLLFVHGNPTWSFAFRGAISELSKTHRCIAPDHIGCGLSDKPRFGAYALEQHVERLERLVLGLGLEDLTLVLHDWGGAIGFGFARRHPDLIARIVLSNTAAFPGGRLPARIAACRIPILGRVAVRGFNGFALAATHMAVERPLDPLVKRGYLLPYDSW